VSVIWVTNGSEARLNLLSAETGVLNVKAGLRTNGINFLDYWEPIRDRGIQKELPSLNSLLRRQPWCSCQELWRRSKKPSDCYWVPKSGEQADVMALYGRKTTIRSTCGPQVWENI
jgi:hypothetical protein